MATTWCEPTGRDGAGKLAELFTNGADVTTTPSTVNRTTPVGAGAVPGGTAGVRVAVRAAGWPNVDGFGLTAAASAVGAGLTVHVIAGAVLGW